MKWASWADIRCAAEFLTDNDRGTPTFRFFSVVGHCGPQEEDLILRPLPRRRARWVSHQVPVLLYPMSMERAVILFDVTVVLQVVTFQDPRLGSPRCLRPVELRMSRLPARSLANAIAVPSGNHTGLRSSPG